MISRDCAAQVRYDIYVARRPTHAVTMDANITAAELSRILDNAVAPPTEERVVISPDFNPRSRKLTAPQRVRIAHLLCFGATLQGLATQHDVRVRSIQHIKDAYTARVGESTLNSKAHAGLNHNMVAESRFRHFVLKESPSVISARLFLNYKSIYRAINHKTYRTNHGLRLTAQAEGLDAESPSGKAVRLYLYGADVAFISDSTDLDQETVRTLIATLTESAA